MKPKIRFPGILLLFWKHLKLKVKSFNIVDDPETYFALGLILLWLFVFLLDILKPLNLHK
jgi:hypothetical protein